MKEKIYYFQEKSNDILDLQDDFTAEEIGMLFILKAAYFKYSGELKEENLCQRCKFFGDKEKLVALTKKIFVLTDGVLINQKWLEEIEGIKERSEKRADAANVRWNKRNKKPKKPKITQLEPKETQSVLPDFVSRELWESYAEMRAAKKKPLTERAIKLTLRDLEKFETRQKGFANLALENAIKGSWQGVFEPKDYQPSQQQKPTDSLATQINQLIGQDLIEKVYETTRDDEKVTEVKFITMHDRDKWLKLSDETKQQAKAIILAKFGNQKMRMA